jgi:rSAM/selenodomain-associated transferase 1
VVTRTLILMVKEPHPGRVKTRLGRDIGMAPAAWWYRHQALKMIRKLQDPRWRLVLAVAPDVEGMRSRVWPRHLVRVGQGRGDLGSRMLRLLAGGAYGPTCVIGSDLPGLEPRHVAAAFRALGRNDVVFGPAEDGGFWLIGARQGAGLSPTVFQSVRWSTQHALQDSVAALSGVRIGYVDRLADVDTVEDLRATTAQPAFGSLLAMTKPTRHVRRKS